jgi:hypothetical protein
VDALTGGHTEKEPGNVRRFVVLSCLTVFSCALAQASARAQPMSDPMRPPAVAESASATPGAGAPATPRLQAVITSPRRKLALIDGSVVPLGGAVRNGTLAGVSDSLAVLKKNGDRDVLLMHPNIATKPATRLELP